MKYLALILVVSLSGCACLSNRTDSHKEYFILPDHNALIEYKAWWGNGTVNCKVTESGHVYTCIIVKP